MYTTSLTVRENIVKKAPQKPSKQFSGDVKNLNWIRVETTVQARMMMMMTMNRKP